MASIEDLFFSAGYVLVRTGAQNVHIVREELLKVEGLRIVHPLLGPDDLICYLETHNPARFRAALNRGVRRLVNNGLIKHTETMIILAEKGRGYSGAENRPAPAAAWLLCDVEVDDPEIVVESLLGINGVVNAHPILGRHDLVAYIEAPSMDELMRILDEDVRQIAGIKRTDTRLVLMKLARAVPSRERENQSVLGVQQTW
jgi:DNA-binding Lrp family transcriptional regulator